MEKEIRDDRKASRREAVQMARNYLKSRDLSWLVNRLLDKGPATEHLLMTEAWGEEYGSEDACKRGLNVLIDLYALWQVKKLWRQPHGIHPGSGEQQYVYGIRGVHERVTAPSSKPSQP